MSCPLFLRIQFSALLTYLPAHFALQGVSSASFQLAVSVVQNCGEKLERYICKFLRSCILNRDAVGSALKEFYHEIIHEIFRYAPQMLFSVVPSLTHELLVRTSYPLYCSQLLNKILYWCCTADLLVSCHPNEMMNSLNKHTRIWTFTIVITVIIISMSKFRSKKPL